MYPLDRGSWGPTVRISHLRDELDRLVQLDLVSGYRGARRLALARYATSGRMRGLDGIYVESSTFLPAEADIAFLGLARTLGIPVLTYIRDAYQLFSEYYEVDTIRRRLGALSFRPAMAALRGVSSRLAFPSVGLARAVFGAGIDPIVIPPGSPDPIDTPRRRGARRLLFVGNGQLAAQGAERLVAAVKLVRHHGADVALTVVSRPGEEPRGVEAPWLRVMNGEGAAIHALLPDVLATVIPRPRGAYNDLALPVKLYDYLAFGRPLLVTDCIEQAAVVRGAGAGIVTGDESAAIADGIGVLMSAGEGQLDRWSASAHRAAVANSWATRAKQILNALGVAA